MADFTVRVEMHGASSEDYDQLHKLMQDDGAGRLIEGIGIDGQQGLWEMPQAEYDITSSMTSRQLCDHVKEIADSVRPGSWVFVTQAIARSWSTKKRS